MDRKSTNTHETSDGFLKYSYVAILSFLTLSGFGQMPIFKRYYIADIPGLGWLAKFYITHYIHYGHAFYQTICKECDYMKEGLILLIIIGAWYLLQAYVLPKLGVST